MATKQRTKGKTKAAAASETSQTIAEQTDAFLKSGGSVTHINTGISGQTGLGYAKKPEAAASEQAKRS